MFRTIRRLANRRPFAPLPADDFTSCYGSAWHVKSFIAPLPDAPNPGLLLTNLFIGPTGIRGFDDEDPGGGARLVAIWAEPGRLFHHTWEGAAAALRDPGAECIALGDERLEWRIEGRWPRYEARLRIPELELEIEAAVTSETMPYWFARTGPLYRHYSDPAWLSGEVVRQGKRGHNLKARMSLEGGRGGHGRGMGLRLFHYQLAGWEDGTLSSLGHVIGPGGLTLMHDGYRLDASGGKVPIGNWRCEIESWMEIPDRAGRPLRVPRTWRVEAPGAPGLSYTGQWMEGNAPFVGIGRLGCGAAELQRSDGVRGTAYIEYLTPAP